VNSGELMGGYGGISMNEGNTLGSSIERNARNVECVGFEHLFVWCCLVLCAYVVERLQFPIFTS
jgi:hypothetical protein